jgi:hypothetical protein
MKPGDDKPIPVEDKKTVKKKSETEKPEKKEGSPVE